MWPRPRPPARPRQSRRPTCGAAWPRAAPATGSGWESAEACWDLLDCRNPEPQPSKPLSVGGTATGCRVGGRPEACSSAGLNPTPPPPTFLAVSLMASWMSSREGLSTTAGTRSCRSTLNSGRSKNSTPPTAVEARRRRSTAKLDLTAESRDCGREGCTRSSQLLAKPQVKATAPQILQG